jgi:16S rRNA (guanine1207-N2)-methyltransferase
VSHYFDADPAAPSRRSDVELVLPDVRLTLLTDRAVFSGAAVDQGTKYLLLEGPRPPSDARALLDLGCGYGPIALVLAARAPQAVVYAVDVNARARELCAINAETAGLGNVRVCAPSDVGADVAFDGLWSNPPIRIGKAALHALLTEWLARLAPSAHAALVVHKHLGSDSLARWLESERWCVARLGSRRGYRILDVTAAGA